MKVSFDGINERVVTFETQPEVKANSLVKLAANGMVAACAAAGDVPVGKAVRVEGGICAVQTGGYMKVPYAAGVAVGYGLFSSDKDGKLASGTTGRPGFVLDVDSAAGVCGVFF